MKPNKKPAVLQLCFSKSWGGLEMVAFEFAQHLEAQKIFCETWTLQGGGLHLSLRKSGLAHCIVGDQWGKVAKVKSLRKRLKDLAATHQVSVVVQQLADLKWLRWALVGLQGVKVTGLSHTFVSFKKKDFFHRWIYQKLDKLIVLTELQKKNILEHLPVHEDQLIVIPNGVDLKKFKVNDRMQARGVSFTSVSLQDENAFLVGLLGRLDPQKGQWTLIKAFEVLQARGVASNLQVVLIGEDTKNTTGTQKQIQEYLQKSELKDRIHLVGFFAKPELALPALNVLVMASRAETFGRVIIEAMACGVPVVATAAGGVPDIIADKVNGLLVPPEDPMALAEALIQLYESAELRQSLSEQGLKSCTEFYDSTRVLQKITDSVIG